MDRHDRYITLLGRAWAGAQNALAGGGSFLILPTLMFAGSTRAAPTSLLRRFVSGPDRDGLDWTGARRRNQRAVAADVVRAEYCRGAIGAVILLITPAVIFARLVPWLVLFATLVFAWGSFFRKNGDEAKHIGSSGAALAQFLISIYGGYFGAASAF